MVRAFGVQAVRGDPSVGDTARRRLGERWRESVPSAWPVLALIVLGVMPARRACDV